MDLLTRKNKTTAIKSKKSKLTYIQKRKINAYILLSPWIIGFILFFLVPLVNTIIYSFSDVGVGEQGGIVITFTGFKNYYELFMKEVSSESQQFLRVFLDENIGIFTNTPMIVIFSLFCAIIANREFVGRGVVRVIFFLPIVIGLKVFVNLSAASVGGDMTTASVSAFDIQQIYVILMRYTFFSKDVCVFIATMAMNVFNLISQAGVQTLIYLAGLQGIGKSHYEVADIEGATAYETFWKVTLPMLANVTLFNIIYTFIDLFLLSNISNEIYKFAFERNSIGVGSALSIVYMLNVLLDLGIFMVILTKVVKPDYENI